MHIFCLRSNFVLVFIAYFGIASACAKSDLSATLVKSDEDKKSVVRAVVSKYKSDDLLLSQLISIKGDNFDFFAVPVLSSEKPTPGCYIQTLNANRQLIDRYLIDKNEDAQSCDAVLAIFLCRQPGMSGLGVIYGMRLGASNYYTEGSYFGIVANGVLRFDGARTKLMSGIESTVMVKKKLGCMK